MKQQIYADNAATTKLDSAAFEAMIPWFLNEYGNPSQPYSLSRRSRQALSEARESIAKCIDALPEEIFFTSGGTESDNWAIKGVAFRSINNRSTITSSFEHHAILRSCEAVKNQGYPVKYINPNPSGYIVTDCLRQAINKDAGLVSIMMVNNEIGTIQPIKSLCEVAHSYGALFHTDAVQAVGHIEIDVNDLGVDMLSASAHKFNGPKGVGFLYVRKGTKINPLLDGGAQEKNMRAGTENVAAIVGMATALQNNCALLDQNQKRIKKLESQLVSMLDSSGVSYKRNGGEIAIPGLLSLSFPGKDGEAILHRMDLMGISISTGSACDSINTEISHVLKAIQLEENYAKGTIRISLGKDNTLEDVITIHECLKKIVM